TDDRVIQIYDADTGSFLPVGMAAEDFVLGDRLVAFRTREAAQGGQDLNADGDVLDDVLQIYDLVAHRLINTGQAVTPCRLEACDPHVPYRVLDDTVRFLTLEADQGGRDLNGDGDSGDLVLQTFNVRLAPATGAGASDRPVEHTRTLVAGTAVHAGALTTLGAISAGICTLSGEACATAADCGGGSCFVPPGGCIADLGTHCTPSDSGSPTGCATGQFCQPLAASPGEGTCQEVRGPCRSQGDCVSPARCNDVGQDFQRLVGPLSTARGMDVFTGAGRCIESF